MPSVRGRSIIDNTIPPKEGVTIDTQKIISIAKEKLQKLKDRKFEVISIAKPRSKDSAVNLAKIVSKLSPLMGNLIEISTCEYLNEQAEFSGIGIWKRQDPGFPDTIFEGEIEPMPGFEIKAWFPLATEITARFKDSQNFFSDDQTYVAMLAWVPEFLVFGSPRILDIVVVSGKSVAAARDKHYHNPPDYIILEPEDTSTRTANLQQTNTSGHKFQGTKEEFKRAQDMVNSWGESGRNYDPSPSYQALLRELIAKFPYRLDTNFAKMDRIQHDEIEKFKNKISNMTFHEKKISDWNRLISSGDDSTIKEALEKSFAICDEP